ncbi:uncharacterized protein LOC129225035 [Uloborus diversus]|uniref:uncharacterized protein LOC129225035 n=1 Tax=Uloborus diversus TaxID=327109 RepID=UPI002409B51D|nr:uncharacterized protein LOC129225035 [Uloborus diversus]
MDLTLRNEPIEEVQQMKYMGINVDNKLRWRQHISYVSNKCEKVLLGFMRISKNVYGVKTDVLKLIYKKGIVPLISYGSRAWGNSLRKKTNSKLLRRVQRRFLIRIVRAYRTVSYDALFVISGLPPIDFVILNDIEAWGMMSKPRPCNFLNGKLPISSLPHPSSRKPITVVNCDSIILDHYNLTCFTDGSKLEGRVGLAFVVYENGMKKETVQHRISDECSVFQAELLCLNLAVKWLQNFYNTSGTVKFIISSTERLVVEVHSIHSALENVADVHFTYIRGHSGNFGSERTDQLAKQATRRGIDLNMDIPGSHWKFLAKEKTIADWNTEYLASSNARWTRRFFPTVFHRQQCSYFSTNFKLSQFLTGHGNFKSYLFRFGISPNLLCDCGVGEQSAEHVLLHCSLQDGPRTVFRKGLANFSLCWPPVFSDLVKRSETFVILSDFVNSLNF